MALHPNQILSRPKRAWIAWRFWKRDEPPHHTAKHHSHEFVAAAKKLDIDAIEDLMNRRLRTMLARHKWLVTIFAIFVISGLIAITVYLTAAPTILKIAVGPKNSDDVHFVEKFAEKLKRERAPFRLNPVVMDGPVGVSDIIRKPDFDLAIVSSNPNMSSDWPVVAILRQNVMVLMAPAPGTHAPAKDIKSDKDSKKTKPVKIEKVPDLSGHKVGIVAQTAASRELLDLVLKQYGVPPEKVESNIVESDQLKDAIHNNQFNAILIAGSVNSKIVTDAVAAASTSKKGPTFIAIDQAEAISQRIPAYEKFEMVEGTFGGSPAKPAENLDSLSFPQYLVASKTLSDTKVAAFSKLIYSSRQALNFELPGVVKIASPSTDKDATTLVHPGTDAYLNDNQKSFFDKYGDEIFYGLLILPIFGSGIAGMAGFFTASKSNQRVRLLYRLLHAVKKARTAESMDVLDHLEAEVDNILASTIHQAERDQVDETGMMSFSLGIEQARLAITERREILQSHDATKPRRPSSTPPLSSAAE